MGEIKNCKKCGRIFSSENGQIYCSRCRNSDEEDFKVVREYIYDNPDSNVMEVSEATGVDEEKILKFLRQGKLVLKGDGVGLQCERCGAAINTGRFCDQCAKEIKSGFSKAFGLDSEKEGKKKEAAKDSKRMHIYGKK